MRNLNLAEKFLSLFCSDEHAAAIVGDLLESRGGRTSVGFWMELIAIAVPQLFFDLRRQPLLIYFHAMKGWSLYIVAVSFSAASFEIAAKFVSQLRFLGREPISSWIAILLIFSCSYSAGRWVLKAIPGKEIALSFGIYLCSALVMTPIYFASLWFVSRWMSASHPIPANWFSIEVQYVLIHLRYQTGFLAAGFVAGWKRISRQPNSVTA